MIRLFQRTMHNPPGPRVVRSELRFWELATIAPVVAVVIALGVYPQFFLDRSEEATVQKVDRAAQVAAEGDGAQTARRESRP